MGVDDDIDDLIVGLSGSGQGYSAISTDRVDQVLASLEDTPLPSVRPTVLATDEHDPPAPAAVPEISYHDHIEPRGLSPIVDVVLRDPVAPSPPAIRLRKDVEVSPNAVGAAPSPVRFLTDESQTSPPSWRKLVSLVAFVAPIAFAFGLLWTQTDVFHPERAARKRQEQETTRAAAYDQVLAKQEKRGQVTITADLSDGAIWLWLGRTPVDTMRLPSGRVHHVRLIHPEYASRDVSVTPSDWSGEGSDRKGLVNASLVAGSDRVPAYPRDLATDDQTAGAGSGVIHVESTPSGADAWLLVGFTPSASISLVAGESYRFMVLHDGYEPQETVVSAADWSSSGSGGPLKSVVERAVTFRRATLRAAEVPAPPPSIHETP